MTRKMAGTPRHRRVVVSGAPGTGKTTVAAALAADLGWPLVALDDVKEALADVLGLGDEAWSFRLGDAAAEVVFRQAARFPCAVVEGWWRRERRDRALLEFAGLLEVFCHCDPAVVEARARARLRIDRHPIHRDVIKDTAADPTLWADFQQYVAAVPPLDLGAGLVRVDTGRPDALGAAVAAVRAALAL